MAANTGASSTSAMPGRLDGHEPESPHEGADHDHLPGNVLQGHAQQGGVAPLQSEERAGQPGACLHAALLDLHMLGRPRGAGSLHADGRTAVVPLVEEGLQGGVDVGTGGRGHRLNHSFSPFIVSGLSMLSVKSSPVPSPCGMAGCCVAHHWAMALSPTFDSSAEVTQ
mgnify:CR=1 FL=1